MGDINLNNGKKLVVDEYGNEIVVDIIPDSDEEIVDTDKDSWNSGANQPDVMDKQKYKNDSDGLLCEDEGDEDNLGNEEDGEPDPDDVEGVSCVLYDDEEWRDDSFDCD